jgi:hypothetical protein
MDRNITVVGYTGDTWTGKGGYVKVFGKGFGDRKYSDSFGSRNASREQAGEGERWF